MARILNLSFLAVLLLFVVYLSAINGLWVSRRRPRPRKLSAREKQERFASKQLQKYGYYTSWVTNKQSLKDAVSYFQTFNNLPKTGKVDKDVIDKLSKPRCGLGDPVVRERKDFHDQYVHGTHWKNKHVTWYWDGIKTSYGKMSKNDIFRTLRHAFQIWDDVCTSLVFKEKREKHGDIDIKFVDKVHRCPFRGDGVGQSIGHAFYPYNNRHMSGDIHFDNAEKFTLNPTNGSSEIHFLWAAIHEIGHSLGLEHSHDPNSIMYPWYNERKPVLRLHENDVIGLKSIYPPTVAKKCRKTKVKTAAATPPPPATTAAETKPMTTVAITTTTRKTTRKPTTRAPQKKPTTRAPKKRGPQETPMRPRETEAMVRNSGGKTSITRNTKDTKKNGKSDSKTEKEMVEWVHFLPVELNDP